MVGASPALASVIPPPLKCSEKLILEPRLAWAAVAVTQQFRIRTGWPTDAPLDRMMAKLKEFAEAHEARILEVGPKAISLRLRYGMNPQIAYRLFPDRREDGVDAVLENTDGPVNSTDIFAVWMTAHHFLDALEKAFRGSP